MGQDTRDHNNPLDNDSGSDAEDEDQEQDQDEYFPTETLNPEH
jgi:hypothetical protein